MKKSTSGDQPRFERGREGMGPAVCESAAGRGHGAPALVTLPHQASPVGGPTGCRAPRRRGTRHGHHSRTPSRSSCRSRAISSATLRLAHAASVVFIQFLRRLVDVPTREACAADSHCVGVAGWVHHQA